MKGELDPYKPHWNVRAIRINPAPQGTNMWYWKNSKCNCARVSRCDILRPLHFAFFFQQHLHPTRKYTGEVILKFTINHTQPSIVIDRYVFYDTDRSSVRLLTKIKKYFNLPRMHRKRLLRTLHSRVRQSVRNWQHKWCHSHWIHSHIDSLLMFIESIGG